MARTEAFRSISAVVTPIDRYDLESEISPVLYGEVAEPTHTDDRNEVTRPSRRVAKSAEGSQSGAEQRRRGNRRQLLGNRHQSARLCDQKFGVTSVSVHSRVLLIAAANQIAVSASDAIPTASPQES